MAAPMRGKSSPQGNPAPRGRYSAHSLRSGLVTTLAERGRNEQQIMQQSRHRSTAMVRVYTRPLDAKHGCPLHGAY